VADDSVLGRVEQTAEKELTRKVDGSINGAINGAVGQVIAVPDAIKQVGSQALTLATEIGNIVSSGAALLSAASSGNMGFLTVPALAALTASQIAAMKNLGSQMDSHGQALGGAAKNYASTEDTIGRTAQTQLANSENMLGSTATTLQTVRTDAAAAEQQVSSLGTNAREV
jgi:hypothetical protein